MQKKFTLIFFAGLTAMMASAALPSGIPAKALKQESIKKTFKKTDRLKSHSRLNVTRAEGDIYEMDWGYCEDPYNAFQLDSYTVNQAIAMPAETATKLAGNQVNSILVGTPANDEIFDEENWEYGNDIKNVTVWMSYDLDGPHFIEVKGKFNNIAFTWSEIPLETPYIIEEGKDLFIGVTYELRVKKGPDGEDYSSNYGFVTDYGWPETDCTNLIYTAVTGYDAEGDYKLADKMEWRDLAELFGNASIRLNISGTTLPVDRAIITDSYMPAFLNPGESLDMSFTVKNLGANPLSSVDICLEYADGSKQTVTTPVISYDEDWELAEIPIGYGQYGLLDASFDGPAKEGYTDFTISIPTINDGATNNEEFEAEGMVLMLSDGYHKNNVVEEGTGTWCGYCPAGYAGMKWLAENYEEDAIGIALHFDDEMDVLMPGNAYAAFESNIEGYPSCFINRNWGYDLFPSPEDFEMDMPAVVEIPALATISATLTPISDDQKTVKLDASVEFSVASEDNLFVLAYTVVEDGVGPYVQTNYFTDEDPGTCYGFEALPSHVELIYDDVARNCSHPLPIEESLPATITPGETYNFSTEIELSDVENLDHYRVVPMILNTKNGFVENACVVTSPSYNYSEVKSIQAENTLRPSIIGGKGEILISGNTGNAKIYTADGRYIGKATGYRTALRPGLYIVTRGNESAKVIVR